MLYPSDHEDIDTGPGGRYDNGRNVGGAGQEPLAARPARIQTSDGEIASRRQCAGLHFWLGEGAVVPDHYGRLPRANHSLRTGGW